MRTMWISRAAAPVTVRRSYAPTFVNTIFICFPLRCFPQPFDRSFHRYFSVKVAQVVSFENCTYNKEHLCSKGDIMVGGKHACCCDQTCCESFVQKREG